VLGKFNWLPSSEGRGVGKRIKKKKEKRKKKYEI
jgi:hypothetical protein